MPKKIQTASCQEGLMFYPAGRPDRWYAIETSCGLAFGEVEVPVINENQSDSTWWPVQPYICLKLLGLDKQFHYTVPLDARRTQKAATNSTLIYARGYILGLVPASPGSPGESKTRVVPAQMMSAERRAPDGGKSFDLTGRLMLSLKISAPHEAALIYLILNRRDPVEGFALSDIRKWVSKADFRTSTKGEGMIAWSCKLFSQLESESEWKTLLHKCGTVALPCANIFEGFLDQEISTFPSCPKDAADLRK
ncbi:hypothetical protein B0H16DRAFT_1446437 [Mycena metata]|uniref:Uncharacterized protein n=1 Tax=Mycena metata TaxID=1033252 RepID=A0AAD7KER4_9AGAR|nr:hypothetical protein B0H16DRAFT_1446437 [Mycena metata]